MLNKRAILRQGAVLIFLISVAVMIRFLCKADLIPGQWGVLRSLIYIGLLSVWRFSVSRRITHTQTRRLLLAITAFMIFWIALRAVKFHFEIDPNLARYIWYLYYLPMLNIPVLALLAAQSISKPETFHLPRIRFLILIPTFALLLLVLTNDMHQFVFRFPSDASVWTDGDYRYAVGYWFVIAWEFLLSVSAIVTMLVKCKVPQSRRILWLPFLPFFGVVAYSLLYVVGVPWLRFIGGDLPVVVSIFISAIFECCIQCGLIQANTHYNDLFRTMRKATAITDADLQLVYTSAGTLAASKEQLRGAVKGAIELSDGLILESMPVTGGYIFWLEDITEIRALQQELKQTMTALAEEKDLLEAEIALKEEQTVADTRNRLYDSAARDISGQFDELRRLVSMDIKDEEERKAALKRMCLIGVYIKRRCNLLIQNEQFSTISSAELYNALRESAEYIRQYGATCTLYMPEESMVSIDYATLAYDFFETILESALFTLHAVLVRISVSDGSLKMNLQAECAETETHLTPLLPKIEAYGGTVSTRCNDGILQVILALPKGGPV